jgi:hypothetical protein
MIGRRGGLRFDSRKRPKPAPQVFGKNQRFAAAFDGAQPSLRNFVIQNRAPCARNVARLRDAIGQMGTHLFSPLPERPGERARTIANVARWCGGAKEFAFRKLRGLRNA